MDDNQKCVHFLGDLDENEEFGPFKSICRIIKEICNSNKKIFLTQTIPKLIDYLNFFTFDLEYFLLFLNYFHVITTIDDSIITQSVAQIISHFSDKSDEICSFLYRKVHFFYQICVENNVIPEEFAKTQKIRQNYYEVKKENKDITLQNIIVNDDIDAFIDYFHKPQKVNFDRIEFDLQDLKPWIVIREENIIVINFALYYGSTQIVKYLLLNECHLNKSSNRYAICGGNLELIRLLMHRGVKYDFCFYDTIRFHRYELSDWLLHHYECEDVSLEKCLLTYNIRAIIYIILNNYDVIDKCNDPPFFMAINHSNLAFVKFMHSKYNFDINKYENDYTPLQIACTNGSLPIVKYLIEDLHAGIYARGPFSETILHIASRNGHFPIVKYLIEIYGFDVTLKNAFGQNAIDVAYYSHNTDIVEYLKLLCISPYKPQPFSEAFITY